MKKLLLLVMLVVCVSSLALSQVSLGTVKEYVLVAGSAADTAGNSLSDTTGWARVGSAPFVSVKYTFVDRYSIQNVRVDYRAQGSTVIVQSDTLAAWASTVDGTTTYREVILRDSKVNYIGVLQGTFRVITNFLASGNDNGTTKYYYIKLLYGGS